GERCSACLHTPRRCTRALAAQSKPQSQQVSEGESQPATCVSFERTHLFSESFPFAREQAGARKFNFRGAHSSPQDSEFRILDCTRISRASAWPRSSLVRFQSFPTQPRGPSQNEFSRSAAAGRSFGSAHRAWRHLHLPRLSQADSLERGNAAHVRPARPPR